MMQDKAALDPENRALYAEILRPPAGYELDLALATTYTLDFETALVVPATMALHAAETRRETLDTPLALLEGLERLASRIAVFCEAGRIKAAPKGASRLSALLEETVVEVAAPHGGAFHPKLWLLRFTPADGRGVSRLRLALLSRNLTTDMSWDLALSLDGGVGADTMATNAPLVDLVTALPRLAQGRPAPKRVTAIARSLAVDLARAEWVMPSGVRDISFAVNGLTSDIWRPRVGRKMGIISPFTTDGALNTLSRGLAPKDANLLGRAEDLALLSPDTLARFGSVLVMDDLAETEDGEETEHLELGPVPARGLHAKAFITERHASTEITLGSGNATAPALLTGENVEIFATLSGYTRHLGTVEDQLAPERLGRFLREFKPYTPLDRSSQADGEQRLDAVRRLLAGASATLRCEPEENRILLKLSVKKPLKIPEHISLRVWPLVLGREHGIDLRGIDRQERVLAKVSLNDVTRWIGVALKDEETGVELAFTLGTTLKDVPEARTAEILRSVVENREAFLRYVRLLLGDVSDAANALFAAGSGTGLSGNFHHRKTEAILEDMVRALSGDGRQLRDVERLVTRLRDHEKEGNGVIPPEFLELWETFRKVMPAEARHV